jgi:hypothetical protein
MMIIGPAQHRFSALRLLLAVVFALTFVVARAEACGYGPACCQDAPVPCPLMGGQGGEAAKSICKTLCLALPTDRDSLGAASVAEAEAGDTPAMGALVVSGPEPPPPRPVVLPI